FIRKRGDQYTLVVTPRFFTRIIGPGEMLPNKRKLKNGALVLPDKMPEDWLDVFTGRRLKIFGRRSLELATVFDSFPVALPQVVYNGLNY
ncbi:hypothetical protein ACFLU1_06075, partial [Chloroflexota bacterium]